jgi:hypothetical protein
MNQIHVMQNKNGMIEEILQEFKPMINGDYEKYRNHLYRVFFTCLMLDGEKLNEDKYAIAAVFHDIGIWTDNTIDYLDPSIEQARLYLDRTGKREWINEITQMIYWHHKVKNYTGEYKETVENFRKADWIDVSLGVLTFGCDQQKLRQNRKQFPNKGFHLFLAKKVGANFFRHPSNPLPMFKN